MVNLFASLWDIAYKNRYLAHPLNLLCLNLPIFSFIFFLLGDMRICKRQLVLLMRSHFCRNSFKLCSIDTNASFIYRFYIFYFMQWNTHLKKWTLQQKQTTFLIYSFYNDFISFTKAEVLLSFFKTFLCWLVKIYTKKIKKMFAWKK